MGEKKEMTAVEFLKGLNRLCQTINCAMESCPVKKARDEAGSAYCMAFVREHPEDAEAVVAEWLEENPAKTLKDDFWEKHPKAKKYEDGTPYVCAGNIYPVSCIKRGHDCLCRECWERPLEV